MKVMVMGASGMLGSMLVGYLSKYFEIVALVRDKADVKDIENVDWEIGDIIKRFEFTWRPPAFEEDLCIINAIGVIKQKLADVTTAYQVNTVFPHRLAWLVNERENTRVLQIATDCVFSGFTGKYDERAPLSPTDVYGKTKADGEVISPQFHHLRCSLIGVEQKTPKVSLLGWFLGQPENAIVEGYVNHIWNGLTTLHFAKVCRAVIENDIPLPLHHHLIPGDWVSKAKLLSYFKEYFDRQDITIRSVLNVEPINRRLTTVDPGLSRSLWAVAGYDEPPTIRQMIQELAEYSKLSERLSEVKVA